MLAGVWTWVRLPPAPLYFKNVEILIVFLLVCLFPTFPLSRPINQPAPKEAGFHVVQALLLLTRHLPLREALVLLTTIPKGILIFFYTQFI